jgi:hypothetical protein
MAKLAKVTFQRGASALIQNERHFCVGDLKGEVNRRDLLAFAIDNDYYDHKFRLGGGGR